MQPFVQKKKEWGRFGVPLLFFFVFFACIFRGAAGDQFFTPIIFPISFNAQNPSHLKAEKNCLVQGIVIIFLCQCPVLLLHGTTF